LSSRLRPPKRFVIFANAPVSDLMATQAALQPGDQLIAADGGLRHLKALGLWPHILVGDLDSVEPAQVQALIAAGVRVERHPARKDQTDLELAIRLACREAADDIVIFGALGGRWDQTLANLLLLGNPEFRHVRMRLRDGAQQVYVVQRQAAIEGDPGDIVSLISLGGDAQGVTTSGLEYPLMRGSLPFGSTLGISNVLLGHEASVTVESGLVMCVVISGRAEAAAGRALAEGGEKHENN
jgi:thiamine pyrophosphokinase